MNPFEMVVAIIFLICVTTVLRARYDSKRGVRRDKHGNEYALHDGEAGRLRDEVRQLKERIIVLERIATDKNHLLEQEIERLRDR
jgi:hypothetical protein